MPTFEGLRSIVEEELRGSTPEVHAAGGRIFSRLLHNGNSSTPCEFVRFQITSLLEPKHQNEALEIFNRIRDRISLIGLQTGVVEFRERKSGEKMKREILRSYEVIRNNGRGVVYLGSARTKPGDTEYEEARELGRDVYELLGSTSWSGAGPGQMEAPLMGAREAGGRVAGIKINLYGHQTKFEQSINDALEPENVACCDYFGPRKIGLADAAIRQSESDRTAIITTPGGFGTRDEFYEYLVLKQLKKLGTRHDVPLILLNSRGSFDPLLADIDTMLSDGFIKPEDLELFKVATSNREALDHLATVYKIPASQRKYARKDRERSPTSSSSSSPQS